MATPTVIQKVSAIDNNGGTGNAAAVLATPAAGNVILAIAFIAGNSNSPLTISDTQSLTWTQVLDHNQGSFFIGCRAWIAYGTAASAETVTVQDGFSVLNIHVYEIHGAASSNAPDGFTINDQSSTGSLSSGGLTTTNANDLLIGAFGQASGSAPTWTAGGSFAHLISSANNGAQVATEDLGVAATGTYTATATSTVVNANETSLIVAISDTAIVPPTPPQFWGRSQTVMRFR